MNVMNKASIAATTTVTKAPTVLDLHNNQGDDFTQSDTGRRSTMNKSSSKFGLGGAAVPRSLNTSIGVYLKKKSREAFSPKEKYD